MEEIKVEIEDSIRIDKYLMDKCSFSRNQIKKLINNKDILVNGKSTKASYMVKDGDLIQLKEDISFDREVLPENIPLDIIYEDEYLLVVNKPSGMVVHPGSGNYSGTLVNALLYKYGDNLSNINGDIRPGIVHRIDADTSGLLLVAKTNEAHESLAKQIGEKSVIRKYIALVYGVIEEDTATIDAPIGRDINNRKKMCVTSINSKDAVTHIRVLERYDNATLIECKLETGRTHQIRVHMAYIGHPVVNDMVYGHKKIYEKVIKENTNMVDKYINFGQMLHAKEIGFAHPITGEKMDFQVDPPKEFNEILAMYKK